MLGIAYDAGCADMLTSGGSEDGGSEPMLGLSGVRKGDLNGFFKVFAASFSLRRLACGVDMLDGAAALGVIRSQVRKKGPRQGERVCLGDACLKWILEGAEVRVAAPHQQTRHHVHVSTIIVSRRLECMSHYNVDDALQNHLQKLC